MKLFMRHYAMETAAADVPSAMPAATTTNDSASAEIRRRIAEAVGVICDEEALDQGA
jgi:hypothetical protein